MSKSYNLELKSVRISLVWIQNNDDMNIYYTFLACRDVRKYLNIPSVISVWSLLAPHLQASLRLCRFAYL